MSAAHGNGRQLFWLIVLFGAPILLGWLFFFRGDLLPAGRSNHGIIVDPALRLPTVNGRHLGDEGWETYDFRGRWTLVAVSEGCGDDCEKALYDLRQIRLATGTDRSRVGRMLVIDKAEAESRLGALEQAFAGTLFLSGTEAQAVSEILRASGNDDGAIYIVDPFGALMMKYLKGTDSKFLLMDLQRLLTVSKHWKTNHD